MHKILPRLGFLLLFGTAFARADAEGPASVGPIITDTAQVFSADDIKALAVAAGTYLEGDERIFSITALDKDTARINIGIVHPTFAHGMRFSLHRAGPRWIENPADKTEIWHEKVKAGSAKN